MRRHNLLAAAGAIAIASVTFGASAANAATFFDLITLSGPGSDFFGANMTDEPGPFTHVYSFSLPGINAASSSVTTIKLGSTDIDFSSISLDSFGFTQTGFDPAAENWELVSAVLGPGSHALTVMGSVVGSSEDGSYSGVLNIALIPEPATWAMMILGFGVIGGVMRKSRQRRAVRYDFA